MMKVFFFAHFFVSNVNKEGRSECCLLTDEPMSQIRSSSITTTTSSTSSSHAKHHLLPCGHGVTKPPETATQCHARTEGESHVGDLDPAQAAMTTCGRAFAR